MTTGTGGKAWKGKKVMSMTLESSGIIGGSAVDRGLMRAAFVRVHYAGGLHLDEIYAAAMPHWRGVFVAPDGSRFAGDVAEGKPNGQGILTMPGGVRFAGWFCEGVMHGAGAMTFRGGCGYEGEWRNGKPNGPGVRTYPDGTRFDGTWRDGLPDGHGIETLPDGTSIEVEYRDGERVDESPVMENIVITARAAGGR